MKPLAARLGLALAGLLGGLVIAAAAYKLLTHRHQFPIKDFYKEDPVLGYDIRENVPKSVYHGAPGEVGTTVMWSNELGCFDMPFLGAKGASRDHILLLGDSFTQAQSYDNWGNRIEALTGFRVLKCGVNGYHPKAELAKAGKVMACTGVPPSLIMVGWFSNDLEEDYMCPPCRTAVRGWAMSYKRVADVSTGRIREQSRTELEDELVTWLEHPLKHAVKTRLRGLTWRLFGAPPGEAPRVELAFVPADSYAWLKKAWRDHLKNLRAFKALAAERKSNLLIVLIPLKEQVYPFLAGPGSIYAGVDLEQPNRMVGRYLRQEGIPFLDLLPSFRRYADQRPGRALDSKEDLFFRDDGHWSYKGQRLAGLLTAKHVLERRMIRVRDRDSRLRGIDRALASFR